MRYNGRNFRRVVNDKKNKGRFAVFENVDANDAFFIRIKKYLKIFI